MTSTAPNPPAEVSNYFSPEELEKLYASVDKEYQPLPFEDAVEFLLIIDKNFALGKKKLHKPQAELLMLASRKDYNIENPLKLLIAAANGSGKDAYFNALMAVFLTSCNAGHRYISTSASYIQLEKQTEAYIRMYAIKCNQFCVANNIYPDEPWSIKKAHLVNKYTHSEIILFVTDEEGRAEGYHPFPDVVESQVTININEAKSVPDKIFDALSRCTYTRWFEVSSPGGVSGKFYEHAGMARQWNQGYAPGSFLIRYIRSYDCPHIPKHKIETDRIEYGEDSALFRSKHLAEFTSVDESVVIPIELISQASQKYDRDITLDITVGIDLAAGGDENSLYAYKGNKKIFEKHWRASDTVATAEAIVEILNDLNREHNLQPENVLADDGNVGHSIIDMIRRQKIQGQTNKFWDICRVCNGSKAYDTVRYANLGAELYFNTKKLFEECLIKLDPVKDALLIKQLSTRYYKQSGTIGRNALESKQEARAAGRKSPDRADAFVLCQAKNSVTRYLDYGKVVETKKVPIIVTQQDVIKIVTDNKWAAYFERDEQKPYNRSNPCNVLRSIYN